MFLRIPKNLQGRDFIAGDIHGAVSVLHQALAQVSFDPSVDRLFLVGDLGDRGPDSLGAIDLLEQPWVHAVAGNHESIFLELYARGEPDPRLLAHHVKRNGLGWTLDLSPTTRQRIARLFARLPLAIELATDRGTVGFVHAEVPIGMTWQAFEAALLARDPRVCEQAVWGRTRDEQGDHSGVVGIDRLFCGHTIQSQVNRRGNVYFADTGAVLPALGAPGHLTMANVLCATQVLTQPRAPGSEPVDLRDAPSTGPFGHYARAPRPFLSNLSGLIAAIQRGA